MNKTAEKIKIARIKAKLSEKQLAKKVGLTANYIEQLESGKKIISESIASKILKALNIKEDILSQENIARNEEVVKKNVRKPIKNVTHKSVDFTASWTGALDNLIRKYPVYSLKTQKSVGVKSLPTVEKKVDGFNCDKLSFIKMDDSILELGILENDIIMIYLTNDITNDKIYYFELENKRYVSKIRKEQNNKIKIDTDESKIIDSNKLKIIGRCVKIERLI